MMHTVLDNGLTVVVDAVPECSRVGISVSYGVGFRSEEPGWEGFAHLFEHLMFRGSENFPNGSFHDHAYESAGNSGGNTHQDYTDYYQRVPLDRLEDALFAEADRMRAPLFTVDSVAEQIAGVAAEITAVTVDRPYGGFPWPLISETTFAGHANAHDGYGSIDALSTATPSECYAFFERHYRPSNATVTVVGDVDTHAMVDLIDRLFGGIEGGAPAPMPVRTHEELTEHRRRSWTEPGVGRRAIAMSMMVPDPRSDLHAYLTALVFARIARDGAVGAPGIDVGCGIFGPLDVADQDIMIATTLVDAGTSADDVVAYVEAAWSALAVAESLDRSTRAAVAGVVTDHLRAQQDLELRARTLGRMTTLFGRPELADEIPARVRRVCASDIGAAAQHFASCAKGILALEPGEARTRPEPDFPVRTLP